MKNPIEAPRVANPPAERPLMVFDGDCGFCRYWIGRWRDATGGRVDYEPYQKVAAGYPEIPQGAFEKAVQFIETDGRVTSGADAVFRALGYASEKSPAAAMVEIRAGLSSDGPCHLPVYCGPSHVFLISHPVVFRDRHESPVLPCVALDVHEAAGGHLSRRVRFAADADRRARGKTRNHAGGGNSPDGERAHRRLAILAFCPRFAGLAQATIF